MKAMVLTAGLGKRLMPLTQIIPKPLFPIINRPVLKHTIEMVKEWGIEEIIANLHHLPDKIISCFGGQIYYSHEENLLGTAGGIKKAQTFLGDQSFVVINGDILADIDLKQVVAYHYEKKSILTLVVREDEKPDQYEPIEMDEQGRIIRFPHSSKNTPESKGSRVMFTGIQIIEPKIYDLIPANTFCRTTEDIYPRMIDEGFPVYGFIHKGYWKDMGNHKDYLKAHEDILDKKLCLSGIGQLNPKGPQFIQPVFIGNNCRLSPYSQIGPYTVMGDNCEVQDGALIEHSVFWNNVVVGTGTVVRNSILGTNVLLGIKKKVEGQMGITLGTQIHLSP